MPQSMNKQIVLERRLQPTVSKGAARNVILKHEAQTRRRTTRLNEVQETKLQQSMEIIQRVRHHWSLKNTRIFGNLQREAYTLERTRKFVNGERSTLHSRKDSSNKKEKNLIWSFHRIENLLSKNKLSSSRRSKESLNEIKIHNGMKMSEEVS